MAHSRNLGLSWFILSFPRLSTSFGHVDYVLLSRMPRLAALTRLASSYSDSSRVRQDQPESILYFLKYNESTAGQLGIVRIVFGCSCDRVRSDVVIGSP